MTTEQKRPMTLYVSYAQKDEALKQEFEDYLVNLQQAQLISGWVERQVQPGVEWSQVIDPRLATTQIFLLLLSPSLFASGYCSGAECREAFERYRTRETLVIPIILREVDLTGHPLNSLQRLPRAGRPVSSWPERSEAWWEIYQGIRTLVKASQSSFS